MTRDLKQHYVAILRPTFLKNKNLNKHQNDPSKSDP